MPSVKIDRLLQASIVLLMGLFIFTIYNAVQEKKPVDVGDSAPSFSITADGGRTVSLSNFGGKILILNFWATWCPPCVKEIPSLDALARQFSARGLVVLGLSIDKDEKAYRDFLSRMKIGYLTARDPDQKINTEYGTFKIPESYIIDQNGKVIQKIVGDAAWMDEKMVNYVQSLL